MAVADKKSWSLIDKTTLCMCIQWVYAGKSQSKNYPSVVVTT